MRYLSLGDSISIDKYTGVAGGGAASQFSRLIRADEFQDLTRDGNLAEGVINDLERVEGQPDVITLTAGGNNLLVGDSPEQILPLIERIAGRLKTYPATVIINTVYDPTDRDDRVAAELGLPLELRERFNAVNTGIKEIAERHGFMAADLEALFHGHGVRSHNTWLVNFIEPNYAGATAIARYWLALLEKAGR